MKALSVPFDCRDKKRIQATKFCNDLMLKGRIKVYNELQNWEVSRQIGKREWMEALCDV